MGTWTIRLASLLSGVIALAMAVPALAQAGSIPALAAPDYGSGAAAGFLSNADFNTPESDGRPGVKFFTLGVQAFNRGDYRHAIDMYKVAASWAYKPAEYNLAVMYFKGQGVPVEHARGAAWMVLAAERGDVHYAKARDLMVTVLNQTEFARTDEIWGELSKTYGDKVALRRAKAQWAWVKSQKTGSRVGGATGELAVGVLDNGHTPKPVGASGHSSSVVTNGFSMMQGGSVDGAVAYRQFQQNDDPYDPVFLKHRSGRVTVEPLQDLHSARDAAKPAPAASAGTRVQRD